LIEALNMQRKPPLIAKICPVLQRSYNVSA